MIKIKDHDAAGTFLGEYRKADRTWKDAKFREQPRATKSANDVRQLLLDVFASYISEALCRRFPGRFVEYVLPHTLENALARAESESAGLHTSSDVIRYLISKRFVLIDEPVA